MTETARLQVGVTADKPPKPGKQSPRWQLFVVWHKTLDQERYVADPTFKHKHYVFLKVNPRYTGVFNPHFGYQLAYEHVLPLYQADLHDRQYMMPGVIYNVYMSRLHDSLDYIGFLEYDIPLSPGTTARIKAILNQHQRCVVPLRLKNSFRRLCKQYMHRLRGQQVMTTILHDFNKFFGTQHSMDLLWEKNPLLVTQQSFVADRQTFGELGRFLAHVVQNKLAEGVVTGDWTRPSTLLDRYIGLALYLLAPVEPVIHPVALEHDSEQGWLLETDDKTQTQDNDTQTEAEQGNESHLF